MTRDPIDAVISRDDVLWIVNIGHSTYRTAGRLVECFDAKAWGDVAGLAARIRADLTMALRDVTRLEGAAMVQAALPAMVDAAIKAFVDGKEAPGPAALVGGWLELPAREGRAAT